MQTGLGAGGGGGHEPSIFSWATASVSLRQKHPVVYVAIIPCDMGSQGEGIGGLGEKDRGWQLWAERGRGTERETSPVLSPRRGTLVSDWANAPIYISLLKGPLKKMHRDDGGFSLKIHLIYSLSFDPLCSVASYYLNFQRDSAKHRLKRSTARECD